VRTSCTAAATRTSATKPVMERGLQRHNALLTRCRSNRPRHRGVQRQEQIPGARRCCHRHRLSASGGNH
jgi:hypothetical protein